MSYGRRVAVVTGGNRGIGFCIVASLCKEFDGDVFLTARDTRRGNAAVEELKKLQLQPKFHQLDVTDKGSIRRLRDYLKEHYGGLDVLVNNAGVTTRGPLKECMEKVVRTNYFGTLYTCEELFPLLRPHARVVNVGSVLGMLKYIKNKELAAKLGDPDIEQEQLSGLMERYIQDFNDGVCEQKGWPPYPYIVSKVAILALTFIQQREFDRNPRDDLVVNTVHPGYVNTDMIVGKGYQAEVLTAEQGADAPTFLSLLPPNVKSPRGEFLWYTREIVDWKASATPTPFILPAHMAHLEASTGTA